MGNAGAKGSGEGVGSAIGGALTGVSPMLPFPLNLVTGLGGTAANLVGKLVGDDPVVAQEAFQQILQQNPQLANQVQVLPPAPQVPPALHSQIQTTPSSQTISGETTPQSNQSGGVEGLLGHLREANKLQNFGPFTHAPTQLNQQIEQLISHLGQGHLTKPTMAQVPTTSQIAPNTSIANKLGTTQLTADVAEQHYVKPIESALVSSEAGKTGSVNPATNFALALQQGLFPQAQNTVKTLENQNQETNIPRPLMPGSQNQTELTNPKVGTSTMLPLVPVTNARQLNLLNGMNTAGGENNMVNSNLGISTTTARPSSFGGILKDTALDVANVGAKELGKTAGNFLRDRGPDLLKQGMSFLGKTLGGLFRGKLVGDAPLQPGTWSPGDFNLLPNANDMFKPGAIGTDIVKMIGDAPIDGVMTNDEATAAVKAMSTSIAITLFAKLVIIEQTLETALPIIFSNNLRQAAAQTARQITVQNGMVRLSQLLFNTDLIGNYFFYDGVPVYRTNHKDWHVESPIYTPTYTGLVPISDSPPLLGNVTYEALKPLLSGAPASEYPSTLRIKTRRTDIDALLTISSQGTYELTASAGYSFVCPLVKLLGYQAGIGQLPGDEMTQYMSGVYPVINFSQDVLPGATIFPWRNGSPDLYNINTWQWLKVAWVTYTEFADAIVGMRAPWMEEFQPIHWGVTCAVVFISRSEMQDGATNIVRMLSHIAYPFVLFPREVKWVQAHKEEGFRPPVMNTTACWPHILNAQIEGPDQSILYVVTDLSDRQSGFITLGIDNMVEVLTDVITPNNPWTNCGNDPDDPAQCEFRHPILMCIYSVINKPARFQAVIMSEIRRWESYYGNNSDRSSAMRWCAEQSVRFGQPKNFCFTPTGTHNIYTGYTYNGDPNVSPYGELADVFIMSEDGKKRWTFAQMLSTTPLMVTPNILDGYLRTPHNEYTTFSTTHFLGQEDPVVNFLIERGMVSPAEEYPTVRFTLAPKNYSAITELAQLMAFIMDSSAQARSVTVKDYYSYPNERLNDDVNQNVITRMALEKVFFPVGHAVCTNGIQKPSFSVNYQSLEYNHTYPLYFDAVWTYLGDGLTSAKNSTVGIFGRIPWSLAERWHPSFGIRDTNTNVYGLDVKITEHMGVNGYQPHELISLMSCDYDVQFIASLFRVSKFLAGLMVSSLQVNNPLWLYDSSTNFFYYLAGATLPLDSVVGRIIALSEAVGVINIPNFNLTPLPTCGFVPTYNIAGGGRKFRFAAIQPVDSFVNPSGSNDYQLFYPVKTQASLRTTIGYHEFGHPLFSDFTSNNPFAY